ncbi:carbohydrate kinase family protein [Patescibacteria group bacterium]|nr:MAG: carbohydrate kinase family protein [Patescibacteria group bacterium]
MAQFLEQLLEPNDPLFTVGMNQLEKANGHAGIDTRLIADITHKAHEVMRQLGLDVADTNGEELYHSLISLVRTGKAQEILIDTDYVMLPFDGGVISFNLIDVIENSHHELAYDKKTSTHGKRSLRGETVERYLKDGSADKTVTTDIATDIGLIRESDKWYNNANTYNTKIEGSADMRPYLLAIGDIFTDAFIKLSEHEAAVFTDENGRKHLIMPFGSKPPYDRVDIIKAVGPSPNAAVSISRLGLHAGLMAYQGDDQIGNDAIENLNKEHIDIRTLSTEKGIPSNYYYVLRYGAERTILVKDQAYSYKWQEPTDVPDWIYLSLISESAWPLHEELIRYLDAHPDTKLAFQPGTFHFEWGTEKLAKIYARSHIIVVNREEAADITAKAVDSINELAIGLHDLGPKIVVITDGPNGSYASYDDKVVTVPNYPDPAPPYDRTGAGDAFASTIVAALAGGETMETALLWAPINSMSVVQKLGAQAGLLSKDEIKVWLDKAPEDYKVKDFAG